MRRYMISGLSNVIQKGSSPHPTENIHEPRYLETPPKNLDIMPRCQAEEIPPSTIVPFGMTRLHNSDGDFRASLPPGNPHLVVDICHFERSEKSFLYQ